MYIQICNSDWINLPDSWYVEESFREFFPIRLGVQIQAKINSSLYDG